MKDICLCGHDKTEHNYDDTDGYYTVCMHGWDHVDGELYPVRMPDACSCGQYKRAFYPSGCEA